MAKIDVNVPDIGDFKDVPVIEVLVKPGDVVKVDQSLVTLESDKATMDVPSPVAGAVAEVVAKVGDKVSMGSLIARIDPRRARPSKLELPPRRPHSAAAAPAAPRRRPRHPRPRRRARQGAVRVRPQRRRRSTSQFPTSAISRMCRSSRFS